MQDLLGGAERIDEEASRWGDSFIVNLGTEALENVTEHIRPRDLDNWHVDGDFFVGVTLLSLYQSVELRCDRSITWTPPSKHYWLFQYSQT